MISVTDSDFDVVAQGLTKQIKQLKIVDRVSFQVRPGSVFGLIGPNGAGKSTTLKMLMNLVRISAGGARLLGADVATDFTNIAHRVGYVPEKHNMYPWMSVERIIRFASAFYPTWNSDLCDEMLRMFELQPQKKVKHLSKGMLAKLALLIAISHEPELLILDEPLSGLDPIVRDEFIDGVMQSICDRETTVIFSSHTIDDVQRLADSVGLLCEGQLLVNSPLTELLGTTKRVRAVLKEQQNPDWFPPSTICQRRNRREWTLTITDFDPAVVGRIKSENSIEHAEVIDISLEELFKDYVIGNRSRHEAVVS